MDFFVVNDCIFLCLITRRCLFYINDRFATSWCCWLFHLQFFLTGLVYSLKLTKLLNQRGIRKINVYSYLPRWKSSIFWGFPTQFRDSWQYSKATTLLFTFLWVSSRTKHFLIIFQVASSLSMEGWSERFRKIQNVFLLDKIKTFSFINIDKKYILWLIFSNKKMGVVFINLSSAHFTLQSIPRT